MPRLAFCDGLQYPIFPRGYSETYWDEPLPETRETARKGIKRNRAEYATILDLDQDAKLIETLSAH